MNVIRRGTVAILAAAIATCRLGPDTARGVAERFVDAHYVRMHLADAKGYCTGSAHRKVETEQRIVGGQVTDEATRGRGRGAKENLADYGFRL